jgi:hypothetical protein
MTKESVSGPGYAHTLLHTMPTLAVVTPVKIVAAGRAPPLARGLPVTLDVPGAWDELAVGAVKAALAERFPQVRPSRDRRAR